VVFNMDVVKGKKMTKLKRISTKNRAKQVKESIKKPREREAPVEFLTSGCTTFNLACSGTKDGAVPRGRFFNLVGDGSSGKSLFANETAFHFLKFVKTNKSEIFPSVKTAKVVYNNGEAVMDFPLVKMYGQKYVDAVEWIRSKNIEQVGRDVLERTKALKKGESLLYIIDSWDSFRSVHDSKILEEKDEEIIKGYALKKQQFAWAFCAEFCEWIDKNNTDVTLFVISQTKRKIGVTFGKQKYRTGGDALNFYTHLVPWIREVKKLTKTRKGEKRVYGVDGEVKVERSKVALPFRTANFRILFDYGVDDIASCGAYLKSKKMTKWHGIGLSDLEEFSKEIEKKGLHEKLKIKVEKLWKDVEEEFATFTDNREKRTL
jgi:RecA/RadA recombinase